MNNPTLSLVSWISLFTKAFGSGYTLKKVKERDSDTDYPYSDTMLDKVYDVTGYLCVARLHNMIRLNRLRSEYRYVFAEYYKMSKYPNGSMAASDSLPAEYLLFRQHSEGLYFARAGNFNFIKIVQAIFMQSLSTDVLILYNAMEPVKMVQKVILNSAVVQTAFKESCFMLTADFTDKTDLVDGKQPICYLYRFLIQGFIRVYSKDIYQLRLSNVLLSKTGASGIRTNLLTLTGNSEKKRKISSGNSSADDSITLPLNSVQDTTLSSYVCICKKEYKGEGWYKRHIMSCSTYNLIIPIDNSAVHLNNLLEDKLETICKSN